VKGLELELEMSCQNQLVVLLAIGGEGAPMDTRIHLRWLDPRSSYSWTTCYL